jgi:hypothetical protein
MLNFYRGKKLAENFVNVCNFQKTTQSKLSPIGENSPNLVTLAICP